MDRHKLENWGYYSYRNLTDGAMASSSVATLVAAEGLDFEDKGTKQPVQMQAPTTEGPGAGEASKDVEDVAGETTRKESEAKKSVVGPENAGESLICNWQIFGLRQLCFCVG